MVSKLRSSTCHTDSRMTFWNPRTQQLRPFRRCNRAWKVRFWLRAPRGRQRVIYIKTKHKTVHVCDSSMLAQQQKWNPTASSSREREGNPANDRSASSQVRVYRLPIAAKTLSRVWHLKRVIRGKTVFKTAVRQRFWLDGSQFPVGWDPCRILSKLTVYSSEGQKLLQDCGTGLRYKKY